ncbi:MAG: serine/threonine-protein kinase [Planctomycetota bacterium]
MPLNSEQPAKNCDGISVDDYFSENLRASDKESFERHLEGCESCQRLVLHSAAPTDDWDHARQCLADDPYDARHGWLNHATPSTATTEDDRHPNESLLLREISGWLDPTDDPHMLGRFGGYEIVGIIGHGGMGIVLKGFESSLNRYVAIKVMAPRLASSGTAKKRFQREAEAAAAVLHDNVIAIHRVGEAHGLPFLVMPYLNGETLQHRLSTRGPLSIQATLRIASQIAAGLSAAHQQGLVHRDVKPANIMLQPGTDRVTITDFGLARAANDAGMTRTGVIAGTPPYMSPEQAHGECVDNRSDLFSLGSVIYAMVTGRAPFRGESASDIIQEVCQSAATPMRHADPSVPDWLENLVGRLLRKLPSDRPQSTQLAQRWINESLLHSQDASNSLPTELLTRDVSDEVKWRSPRRIAALATVLVVTAFIIWMKKGATDHPTEDASSAQSSFLLGQKELAQTAHPQKTQSQDGNLLAEQPPAARSQSTNDHGTAALRAGGGVTAFPSTGPSATVTDEESETQRSAPSSWLIEIRNEIDLLESELDSIEAALPTL